MKLIELNKRYYEFPTAWDELTAKQLLQVMDVLFLKDYKAEQMLLRLVQVLTGMSNYQFFRCAPEELEEYFYLLVFLLKEDIDFTKNLLPTVNCPQSTTPFYGPADAGNNLRMAEFSFAEDFFIAWSEVRNEGLSTQDSKLETLNSLVATLYRPLEKGYDTERNEKGDPREPYNDNLTAYYVKNFVAHWPLNLRLAIATWYGGVRRHIITSNPDVFEGSGGEPARFGLVSVMLNVAEEGVLGKFSEVENEFVSLVMMHLTDSIDKAKKLTQNSKL